MFLDEKPQGEVTEKPATLDEESRLLLKAAALIEQYGLAKEMQCDELGRMCVAGALIMAEGRKPGRDDYGPIGSNAVKRFVAVVDPGAYGPAPWNNAPERTQEQVVAKLRAVALMPRG